MIKAEAILDAIRKTDVGNNIILHNNDMSVSDKNKLRKKLYDKRYFNTPIGRKNRLKGIKKYYKNNKEKILIRGKEYRTKARLECLKHYSKGTLKCKCGYSDIRALCIDHINGGGTKHREIIGLGSRIYYWLIKNNFPDGFQVLCHNCNWLKRIEYNI